ncbi:MAG: hypothetical protein K4571_08930 [Deltaproteobacteria bacterium]
MGLLSAADETDGACTKDGADHDIERAKGGVGLIITGLRPVGLVLPIR